MASNDLIRTHQLYVDVLKHHETLLFQRLNYFLVGNAFLTAAFAALIVGYFNVQRTWVLMSIGCLVAVMGMGISLFFQVTNFHNSSHIRVLYLIVERIEKKLKIPKFTEFRDEEDPIDFPVSKLTQVILRDRKYHPGKKRNYFGYLWDSLKEALPSCPRNPDECDYPAPSTWLTPFFFFLFWLIAFGILIIYFVFFRS
jgi:hypothetical protein